MINGPTLDRRIKSMLAGVFETTPVELFLTLDARADQFDDQRKSMMKWHLRNQGYEEREVSTGYASSPMRLR